MATIGNTDAASVIETLTKQIFQDTLIQESVMIPLVQNESGRAVKGIDTIKIPRLTSLSVNSKSEDVCDVPQAPTIATDDLLLDLHKIISFEIEDITNIQSTPDIIARLIADSARVMAADVDDEGLSEMLANVSAAAPDHILDFSAFAGPPTTYTKDMILEARRLLNIARVPMGDRWMVANPDCEKDLLAIDDFVHAEKYGFSGNSPGLANGELGKLYGFRVVVSTSSNLQAKGKEALFFHRSAAAYASQAGTKGLERDRNVLCKKDEYSMDMLYGWKTLDSGKRMVRISETA